MKKVVLSLLALSFFSFPIAPAAADDYSPRDTPTVIDNADFFSDADEAEITAAFVKAYEYYDIVTTVETFENIGRAKPGDFAEQRANELGIGDPAKNNGLYLLFLSKKRYYFMQPGIGVKEVVAQDDIQTIVNILAIPNFKKKNYVSGIVRSVDAVGQTYVNGGKLPDNLNEALAERDKRFRIFFIGAGILLLAVAGWFFAFGPPRDSRFNKKVKAVEDLVAQKALLTDYLNAQTTKARHAFLASELKGSPTKAQTEAFENIENNTLKAKLEKIYTDNNIGSHYREYPEVSANKSIASIVSEVQNNIPTLQAKEAEDKAKAEALWASMSDEDKVKLKNARTKADKQKVLQSYNNDGLDPLLLFAILYITYPSNVGTPYSPSSTYSSSSSSSGSFSGGGFDGGGAGGGW